MAYFNPYQRTPVMENNIYRNGTLQKKNVIFTFLVFKWYLNRGNYFNYFFQILTLTYNNNNKKIIFYSKKVNI